MIRMKIIKACVVGLIKSAIDEYEKELSRFVSKKIVDLQPARGRQQKIAGLIVDQRVKKTKRGDSLCFLTLDDRSARIDITLYGEIY